jgi:hypothetical protein
MEFPMKTFGKLILGGIGVLGALQLIRPGIPSKPATAELQVPPPVRHVLEKDCYSCHSDQRRLAWFDHVVPAYWLVRHDILTAREHLNFSTLGSQPPAMQKAALYEAVNMVQLGAMPLPAFVKLHPEARVSPEELAILKTYLAPWAYAPILPNNASSTGREVAASDSPTFTSLEAVHSGLNGVPFDPSFERWRLISTTNRGDNNTFRFILGNDIAVRAAQTGNITPWPDGARFAKIAWQQQTASDGLAYPGKFVQVELMIKSAKQYKDTEGWGWGRWRGTELKPYGNDARFVTECTSCHQPLHGNDYVYTLPISEAKVSRPEIVNNAAASLPKSLPYQPLGWAAITMYVNPKNHTTATLYGNEAAMSAVKAVVGAKSAKYPVGAVVALVTWVQRDDPHWFGARIPNLPESVEFVRVMGDASQDQYRRFAGNGLLENRGSQDVTTQRTAFILGLVPAQLP